MGVRPGPHRPESWSSSDGYGLSPEQINHLVWRYGSRTLEVVGLLRDDGDLKQMSGSGHARHLGRGGLCRPETRWPFVPMISSFAARMSP